ncbi:Vacuolar fusion protein mon1, partial [Chytridiales sp. JEL 0842]
GNLEDKKTASQEEIAPNEVSGVWRQHRKNFFVLSSAGKPVYARYGDLSELSGYIGLMQAIISFFLDGNDSVESLKAGDNRFVFLRKEPLYLVCASGTGESESESLLYGLLLYNDKVISMIKPKKHNLTSSDAHLLINMVNSSTAFRTAEAWTPICLPDFDDRSFLHAYVCFISQDISLVLVSVSKDTFFEMSEYKQDIVKGLEEGNVVDEVMDAIERDPYQL